MILRQDCKPPKALRNLPVLDFRSDRDFKKRFSELIAALCPATKVGLDDVNESVDVALEACVQSDPGGFATGPTAELELPQGGWREHSGRHVLPLALLDR